MKHDSWKGLWQSKRLILLIKLLKNCEHYGLSITKQWLQSYLNNRLQYVTLNDIESQSENVKCGLPQGSVLGPKWFILYFNDIFSVSTKMKCITFADDTNLFCSGHKINELIHTAEKKLAVTKKWFADQKWSLNDYKSKCMIFSGNRNVSDVNFCFNGVEIEVKFLGVMIIDSELSWKPHIDYVKMKVSKVYCTEQETC